MATTGLILGKFAPLHKGHQYLIDTAITLADRVVVAIYDCPETTSVPLTVRAAWVRELFPAVEVIETAGIPVRAGGEPQPGNRRDIAVAAMAGRKITHFFSGQADDDQVSLALGAENCLIDEARSLFPISALQIRANLYEHRSFLNPRVYRDLITNVVFLGAPSTGKSTLAESLARKFGTVWMREYGREYWETHQISPQPWLKQLVRIAEGHLEREDLAVCQANKYLFIDTNAITTYMFSLYYHNEAHPRLAKLAEEAASRYDVVFLCDDDIPYEDTQVNQGAANRKVFQEMIVKDLKQRGIPFTRLSGSLLQREATVCDVLAGYRKYGGQGQA
jgi:HTH-type transcriptional regulator, transcriptional repressor of NAD biosynthesis genes